MRPKLWEIALRVLTLFIPIGVLLLLEKNRWREFKSYLTDTSPFDATWDGDDL
jgi:hypothetical protein